MFNVWLEFSMRGNHSTQKVPQSKMIALGAQEIFQQVAAAPASIPINVNWKLFQFVRRLS